MIRQLNNAFKIVFLCVFGLWTQTGFAQDFNAGFIGGINTSQIDGDNYQGFNKIGYQAGVFGTRTLNDQFKLEVDILWTNKGSRMPSRPDLGNYNTYFISLNYAEVPVLVTYSFDQFVLQGGLSAGTMVSNYEADENGEVTPTSLSYNRGEVAYVIGVKYNLTEKFCFDLRHSRSITPIADSIERTTTGLFGGGSYNNILSLNMQYRFMKD